MSVATPPNVVPSVRRMTAAEFDQLQDTGGLELDDGVVVENPMGTLSSWVAGELHSRMAEVVRRDRLGWAFPQETAFECFPPTPSRIRKPDAAFVAAGRLAALPEGNCTVVPDLTVEVVSPNDTADKLERKLVQFLAAGVRLVWVIYPEARTARVHRSNGSAQIVKADGFLDGEDVVPGFRVQLSDLFPADPMPPVNAA